jgi:signal transduction histidine kinase
MHRFLGVPVMTGDGHVFGNLYLTDRADGEAFSEEDEQLTVAFGRAAGLVIDQDLLRKNVRALTLAQERERLARDLHDTVIQRLFGVGLALRNSLPGILEDDVRDRIEDVLDELEMTIQEIRTTIFEIDQDNFIGQSLEDRVTTLSLEIGSRLGVHAKVKVASDIDTLVGPRCAQHCVQALREILSNVVRHSSATEVDIELAIDDALVEVIVRDNGVGFTPNIGSGGGVRNLSSRARELGGNCSIDSRIGGGTTVRWTANRSF